MVGGKSKGPGPKRTRVSKKKKKHIIKHTLSHLRGGGDYPQSHQRTRVIDSGVAGAGLIGARFKAPRNAGVTVPRVGASVGTQAKKKTKNSSSQSDPIRQAAMQSSGSQANMLPGRADAGVQFKSDVRHAGVQVGSEGPRYPPMGDRPRYAPYGVRNKYPAMLARPQYTENPGKVEAMLDRPEKMQGVVKAKQQGPQKMQIQRAGRVRTEVAKIDSRVDPGNEIVGAPDVMRAAPKPQADRPKKQSPKPKAAPKKEAPRAKPRKADPAVPLTAAQEAEREQGKIDAAVADKKTNKEARIEAMREHIKKTREGRVGPERAALKKEVVKDKKEERRKEPSSFARAKAKAKEAGHVPSASANIPKPDGAGPSEHHHHHTGHKHMHDDDFGTFL